MQTRRIAVGEGEADRDSNPNEARNADGSGGCSIIHFRTRVLTGIMIV